MSGPGSKRLEWPSIALCFAIYGSFLGLTWWSDRLPVWVFLPLGALLIAWHSSMQHEFIHGHPTPWSRVNRALASVPLSLWLPFESYRMSHLVHHCDEKLTDPLDDPESYYWSPADWQALGPLGRLVVRAHTTLAGRLVIGPAWNISRYLVVEFHAVRTRPGWHRRIWRSHAIGCVPVLLWTLGVCRVDPLLYGLTIYAGTSLLLLRSFAEHRAHEGVFERTAIVENAWFFGPLFLFNNLHAAHHELPRVPWYELPAWYRANRQRLVIDNGGLVYNGYADVARRFLFRPHDATIHPFTPASEARVAATV
ncbi:fatty acid desaturase [Lichenifustis flavocetrariae]|uniref:Fatty acid desaturase n=1 Tax=Lichenifustis flavocetrariae TaxID=2949735 RepID=A0AA41YTN5_9HYPH|nr:fatty acid desaturase [Lichenifustis flavocetrariae]MCW6508376.1 fatty acid desaturase [Lichenifustis flavocetrariae]